MEVVLLVAAVVTAVLSTSVVIPAAYQFTSHVTFRHWEVIAAIFMHLCGLLQAGILIYAVSIDDRALKNEVVMWGVCGIGMLPWCLLGIGWTNALHRIKGVRLWYAVPVLATLILGLIYLTTDAAANDNLNDTLTTVGTMVLLLPVGMLLLTRSLRRYKRHENIRDMFLITLLFQVVLIPGFHHLDTVMRNAMVGAFAISQPLLLARVLVALWWYRHRVFRRFPWQFYFATVEELDKLPSGVKIFLTVLQETCYDVDADAIQREIELWITNESLYAMKLHDRTGRKFDDTKEHVRELLYGPSDQVHELVYPEKTRVICINYLARMYQHHLLHRDVRKNLALALFGTQAVDLDSVRKKRDARQSNLGLFGTLKRFNPMNRQQQRDGMEMQLVSEQERDTIELPGDSNSDSDSGVGTVSTTRSRQSVMHYFDTPQMQRRANAEGGITIEASDASSSSSGNSVLDESVSGKRQPWGHDQNDWEDEPLDSDDSIVDPLPGYESSTDDEDKIVYGTLRDFKETD